MTYELKQAFAGQLHAVALQAGIGPLVERLILKGFDRAVQAEQDRQRTELQRAGLLRKAA